MEAFSLLKYWRPSGGGGGGGGNDSTTATKTIVTAAVSPCSSDGEDGTYFDLEFALPEDESDTEEEYSEKTRENDESALVEENHEEETDSGTGAEELSENENDEVKFSLTRNDGTDRDELTISPADDGLLFEGNVDSDENSKFPISLGKSATKFRVLLLKLKKSKTANGFPDEADKSEKEVPTGNGIEEKQDNGGGGGLLFTVKCKVEEVRMPLVSLFTRDNSSKGKQGKGDMKDNPEDSDSTAPAVSASNERKLSKEVVQKYLKMVKPLYIRVSKRYVEKLKFSGQLSFSGGVSKGGGAVSPPPPPEKGREVVKVNLASSNVKSHLQKQVGNNNNKNLQAGLKVVRKHLGKSRSASATVAPPPPPPPQGKITSSRRDDSLLQLHDGIQSAILHCKKSFNASRDGESSILSRSVSDPSYEKSINISADSSSSSSSSLSGGEAHES